MPILSSVVKPNGQPYTLIMPPNLNGYTQFHASLGKIIFFWRFHSLCLPSFLENKFHDPIASRNPPDGQQFDNVLYGQDYDKSAYKKDLDSLNQVYMPKISYLDGDYEIFQLKDGNSCFKRFFGVRSKVIDRSDYKIMFGDGRHRARYFEFIGSQDIWVAIPINQVNWFQVNCSYP